MAAAVNLCDFDKLLNKITNETLKKKRTLKEFTYRGVDLDQLLHMPNNQLVELMHSRARKCFSPRPKAQVNGFNQEAKKEALPNGKSENVKTHLRYMIIVPEMTGSIIGVYNGFRTDESQA